MSLVALLLLPAVSPAAASSGTITVSPGTAAGAFTGFTGARSAEAHSEKITSRLAQVDTEEAGSIIEVTVHAAPDVSGDALARALRPLDLAIGAVGGSTVDVRLNADDLDNLAARADVALVDLPTYMHHTLVSEGVGPMGAERLHMLDRTGRGVDVAVFDTGFDPTHPEIASNVVSTVSFDGGSVDSGDNAHGTACAELVVDVAPHVNLHLVKTRTTTEVESGITWAINNGIDVISISLGTFMGPFDGSSSVSRAVEWARENGIAVAVSAGNSAQSHWAGPWKDSDGDEFLEFSGAYETIPLYLTAGRTLTSVLTWNAWPVTNQDYDFYLVNQNMDILASSTAVQNGNDAPREGLQYTTPYSQWLHLIVHKYSASGAHQFHVFASGADFHTDFRVPEGSITIPGDARGAFSAAAADWSGSHGVHDYSSRGPTDDGRVLPLFAAASGVTTASYGSSAFYGTSAAAPHLAGAVALVRAEDPRLGVAGVEGVLARHADDLGSSGRDTATGYGWVNAYDAVREADRMPPGLAKSPFEEDTVVGSGPVDVVFEFTDQLDPDAVAPRVQLELGDDQAIAFTQLGVSGQMWHGRANIPDSASSGVAVITVTGARDWAGNTMVHVDRNHSVIVDTEPPEVELSPLPLFVQDDVAVLWTARDEQVEVDEVRLEWSTDNVTWNSWFVTDRPEGEATWMVDNLTHNQSFYFRGVGADSIGNSAEESEHIVVTTADFHGPRSALALVDRFASQGFDIAWNATDEPAGVATVWLQASEDNATWTTWLTSTSAEGAARWVKENLTHGETTHFRAKSRDHAGNEVTPLGQRTVTADLVPPEFSLDRPDGANASAPFRIEWDVEEDLSGLAQLTLQWSTDNATWYDWFRTSRPRGGVVWSNLTHDTRYHFRAEAVDVAGNTNEPAAGLVDVLVDLRDPVVDVVLEVGEYATEPFYLDWAATDSTSDIARVDVEVSVDEQDWDVWLTTARPEGRVLWSNLTDGVQYAYRIRASDKAGNENTNASPTVDVLADLAVPTLHGAFPSADETIADPTPVIQARLWDNASGIDWSRMILQLDRRSLDVTSDPDTGAITARPSDDLAEGIHTLTLTAWDQAGHRADWSWQFEVDLTPPGIMSVTTDVSAISPNSDGARDKVTLEIASEDYAEVRVLVVDDGGNHARTISFGPVEAGEVAVVEWDGLDDEGRRTSDGVYSLRAEAKDNAGNVAVVEVPVRVDTVPPPAVANLSALPVAGGEVDLEWQKSAADVDYVVVRGERAGEVNPAPFTDPTFLTQELHMHLATPYDDIWSFAVLARDDAHNMGPASQITVVSDSVPPNVNFSSGVPDGQSDWHVTVPSLRLTSPESEAVLQYRYESEDWRVTDDGYVPARAGAHIIQYRGWDAAGNVGGAQSATVRYDSDDPVILSPDATQRAGPGGWFRGFVTLHSRADDETSGIAQVERWDQEDGEWVDGTEVTLSEEGPVALRYRAFDVAGRESGLFVHRTGIDHTAPELFIRLSPDGADRVNGWYTEPLTARAIATDSVSYIYGVTLKHTVSGGPWRAVQAATLDTEGEHKLWATAIDAAGNGRRAREVIYVDTRPPELVGVSQRSITDGIAISLTFDDFGGSGIDVDTIGFSGVPGDVRDVSLESNVLNIVVQHAEDGEFRATVSGQDVAGHSFSNTFSFEVLATGGAPPDRIPLPSNEPLIVAVQPFVHARVGERVQLTATVHDSEGGPVRVTWHLMDGRVIEGTVAEASFDRPGVHRVYVEASNEKGASVRKYVSISVIGSAAVPESSTGDTDPNRKVWEHTSEERHATGALTAPECCETLASGAANGPASRSGVCSPRSCPDASPHSTAVVVEDEGLPRRSGNEI